MVKILESFLFQLKANIMSHSPSCSSILNVSVIDSNDKFFVFWSYYSSFSFLTASSDFKDIHIFDTFSHSSAHSSTYASTSKASMGYLNFLCLFINCNLFNSSSIDTCLKVYWLFAHFTEVGVLVSISFSINDKFTAVLVLIKQPVGTAWAWVVFNKFYNISICHCNDFFVWSNPWVIKFFL